LGGAQASESFVALTSIMYCIRNLPSDSHGFGSLTGKSNEYSRDRQVGDNYLEGSLRTPKNIEISAVKFLQGTCRKFRVSFAVHLCG